MSDCTGFCVSVSYGNATIEVWLVVAILFVIPWIAGVLFLTRETVDFFFGKQP